MEKYINTKLLSDQKFWLDVVLFGAGPFTAVVAARLGRRAWIKYEIAASVLIALVMAFKADLIFSIVLKSSPKPFHYFLSALYAGYLVSFVLVPLLVRNSVDESIFYGHYYARIVESSLIAIENFISYNDGVHWNYKYLCFVTSMALTHLAINAYFLARTPKPSGQNPFKDLANSVGKLDFYVCLVAGAYLFAFPDRVNVALAGAGAVNESYRSLTRSCGAIMIGASLESFCMSEFKFIRDKKNFLLARLLSCVIEISVFFSGFYCLHVYSLETFGYLTFINVSYALLNLYGYLKTPHEHIKSH